MVTYEIKHIKMTKLVYMIPPESISINQNMYPHMYNDYFINESRKYTSVIASHMYDDYILATVDNKYTEIKHQSKIIKYSGARIIARYMKNCTYVAIDILVSHNILHIIRKYYPKLHLVQICVYTY